MEISILLWWKSLFPTYMNQINCNFVKFPQHHDLWLWWSYMWIDGSWIKELMSFSLFILQKGGGLRCHPDTRHLVVPDRDGATYDTAPVGVQEWTWRARPPTRHNPGALYSTKGCEAFHVPHQNIQFLQFHVVATKAVHRRHWGSATRALAVQFGTLSSSRWTSSSCSSWPGNTSSIHHNTTRHAFPYS